MTKKGEKEMDEHTFNLDALIENLKKEAAATRPSIEAAEGSISLEPDQLEHLHALCQSKAEEFALIGYDKINKEEIWRYFESKYRNAFPPLHRIVNEILSLKVTTYMNWETINAYKGI